jgi:3-methylfumaryl-CoA hydratase
VTQPSTTTALADHVAGWNPGTAEVSDELSPVRAAEFAATLDLEASYRTGDALPLLWHWVYFLDWPATASLGADGHPHSGPFLPPIPHRRRMFAGGRVSVHEPLRLGRPAHRRSRVTNTTLKHGRSGEMFFVTVEHEYLQDGRVALTEEQDLVYRSDAGKAAPGTSTQQPLPPPDSPWQSSPETTPQLLFRFGALTANAHRIHYDSDYTRDVEGFPALVIHGPLLAIYMAELLRARTDRAVSRFSFRLRQPAFLGDTIQIHGTPTTDAVELAVSSATAAMHASAAATLS